jgi:hypothetical protein
MGPSRQREGERGPRNRETEAEGRSVFELRPQLACGATWACRGEVGLRGVREGVGRLDGWAKSREERGNPFCFIFSNFSKPFSKEF